jgi:hypothetical protein
VDDYFSFTVNRPSLAISLIFLTHCVHSIDQRLAVVFDFLAETRGDMSLYNDPHLSAYRPSLLSFKFVLPISPNLSHGENTKSAKHS